MYTASPTAAEDALPLTDMEVRCPLSPSPSATSSSSSSAGAADADADVTMTKTPFALDSDSFDQTIDGPFNRHPHHALQQQLLRFKGDEKPEFDFSPYIAQVNASAGVGGGEDEGIASLRMQEMLRLESQRRQIEQLQEQHRQLLALEQHEQRRQAEEAAAVLSSLRPSIPRAAFRQGDWM